MRILASTESVALLVYCRARSIPARLHYALLYISRLAFVRPARV